MFVALYTVVVLLSNRFQVENFVSSMIGFIHLGNTKFVVDKNFDKSSSVLGLEKEILVLVATFL